MRNQHYVKDNNCKNKNYKVDLLDTHYELGKDFKSRNSENRVVYKYSKDAPKNAERDSIERKENKKHIEK